MGSVWLANHDGLKCEVVVKFILDEVKAREDIRARFEREASLLAMAKSPHVVQVYDHGTSVAGLPYIAMEHLVGEDLETRLRREGRVEPRLLGEWFRQACVGLGRAHSRGIVHRDLKPANLFLAHEEEGVVVKILDFGIAKGSAREELFATTAGALLGTAYYMSPEQAQGRRDIDLRSDLWSMGVVAYHSLTGNLPFAGESVASLAVAIVQEEFRRPSELLPGLPKAVDAWMERALAKSPDHRYGSARALSEALSLALGDIQSAPGLAFGGERAGVERASYPVQGSQGPRGQTTLSPAITGSQRPSSMEFWGTRSLPQRTAFGAAAVVALILAIVGATSLLTKVDALADLAGRPVETPKASPDDKSSVANHKEPELPERGSSLQGEPTDAASTEPIAPEKPPKSAKLSGRAGAHPEVARRPNEPKRGTIALPANPGAEDDLLASPESQKARSKGERTLEMPLH